MLEELTSDVKVEPTLKSLSGEEIKGNQSDEARSDISPRGFWITGQRAHRNKTLRKYCEINEQEKRENTVHEF